MRHEVAGVAPLFPLPPRHARYAFRLLSLRYATCYYLSSERAPRQFSAPLRRRFKRLRRLLLRCFAMLLTRYFSMLSHALISLARCRQRRLPADAMAGAPAAMLLYFMIAPRHARFDTALLLYDAAIYHGS